MTSQFQPVSQAPSPGEPVTIETSTDRPDWDAYLGGHGQATIYHDARWGEVMRASYGNSAFYLTARRGDRIVGVVQLVWQKSMLWGSHLCSMPYFDASGILADDEHAATSLLDAASELGRRHATQWVELRQMNPVGDSLPIREDKVTMHLQLPTGAEAMWKQLKTKVRTKVRKAEKEDLTVLQGRNELLDDFCDIYIRAMRDLGSPPHSRRFFRNILDAFGQDVLLFSVRSAGRPLAASLALVHGRYFHVPWSGSDMRFRRTGANRILYWSMLKYAAEAGLSTFDFGRSTVDSGTYGFKKEWGAEPVQLYWQYLLPEGKALPDQRPDSPKYRFMVACWKKLPLCVARTVGPRIIAKLS